MSDRLIREEYESNDLDFICDKCTIKQASIFIEDALKVSMSRPILSPSMFTRVLRRSILYVAVC